MQIGFNSSQIEQAGTVAKRVIKDNPVIKRGEAVVKQQLVAHSGQIESSLPKVCKQIQTFVQDSFKSVKKFFGDVFEGIKNLFTERGTITINGKVIHPSSTSVTLLENGTPIQVGKHNVQEIVIK